MEHDRFGKVSSNRFPSNRYKDTSTRPLRRGFEDELLVVPRMTTQLASIFWVKFVSRLNAIFLEYNLLEHDSQRANWIYSTKNETQ